MYNFDLGNGGAARSQNCRRNDQQPLMPFDTHWGGVQLLLGRVSSSVRFVLSSLDRVVLTFYCRLIIN